MSTVAAMFSGAAATTLQMSNSVTDGESLAMLTIDALWQASLIFSVGAMLNNLVLNFWSQSRLWVQPYKLNRLVIDLFRRLKTPKLLWWWIEMSPAILLALAVVAFSAGLILWAFASHQVTPDLSLFRSLELTRFRQG